jgi:hypothetical protein
MVLKYSTQSIKLSVGKGAKTAFLRKNFPLQKAAMKNTVRIYLCTLQNSLITHLREFKKLKIP